VFNVPAFNIPVGAIFNLFAIKNQDVGQPLDFYMRTEYKINRL
jgi:hypothetical protein